MKQLYSMVIALLCATISQAQWVHDYSHYYQNNGKSGWQLSDSIQYFYTGLQLDSTITWHSESDGETYVPSVKEMFGYDANGYLSDHTNMYFDGSQWVFTNRDLFNNNAQGNVLQDLFQMYAGGGLWTDGYRTVYTYDANGFATTIHEDVWDSDWVPYSEEIFVNDDDGHVSSTYSEYYDGTWYPGGTSQYTYADGLLTLREVFDAAGDAAHKDEYTYDDMDRVISLVSSDWASSYNTWLYHDYYYTYDSDGNLMHESGGYLDYTGGGTTYFPTLYVDHFYILVVVNVDEITDRGSLYMYPNPADNTLCIPSLKGCDIYRVTDPAGRIVVISGATPQRDRLNISDLPCGIYIVSVWKDGKMEHANLVVDGRLR